MYPASDCQLCPLATQGRSFPVNGAGPVPCEIMLVGEAPGADEDRSSVPFVGRAGVKLNSLLLKAGIERKDCYVSNLVACRPPGNRDPHQEEIDVCISHFLDRQVATVDPVVIVAIGRVATNHFLPGVPLAKVHGFPQRRGSHVILPVYHPAAGFYSDRLGQEIERDFGRIPDALRLARQDARSIRVVDAILHPAELIAIDTEYNRDGSLVAVSMSADGETAYVSRP